MKSLKTVRKRAGLSQRELAERIGTFQSNIAAIENGGRAMSLKMADRILEEIGGRGSDATGADLVLDSRLRSFQRAEKSRDVEKMAANLGGVLKMVASEATPGAMPLVEEMAGKLEEAIDEEDEDDLDGDERDLFGRVRPAMKNASEDDDDGRDMFGRVIRPIEDDLDGDDEDEDDYEDGDELDGDRRDIFGRRVGA